MSTFSSSSSSSSFFFFFFSLFFFSSFFLSFFSFLFFIGRGAGRRAGGWEGGVLDVALATSEGPSHIPRILARHTQELY